MKLRNSFCPPRESEEEQIDASHVPRLLLNTRHCNDPLMMTVNCSHWSRYRTRRYERGSAASRLDRSALYDYAWCYVVDPGKRNKVRHDNERPRRKKHPGRPDSFGCALRLGLPFSEGDLRSSVAGSLATS
jgi:hypothetical protein